MHRGTHVSLVMHSTTRLLCTVKPSSSVSHRTEDLYGCTLAIIASSIARKEYERGTTHSCIPRAVLACGSCDISLWAHAPHNTPTQITRMQTLIATELFGCASALSCFL
ncbi:unnamed protein product [Ectocarpus sp. 12 AP-2014]